MHTIRLAAEIMGYLSFASCALVLWLCWIAKPMAEYDRAGDV